MVSFCLSSDDDLFKSTENIYSFCRFRAQCAYKRCVKPLLSCKKFMLSAFLSVTLCGMVWVSWALFFLGESQCEIGVLTCREIKRSKGGLKPSCSGMEKDLAQRRRGRRSKMMGVRGIIRLASHGTIIIAPGEATSGVGY